MNVKDSTRLLAISKGYKKCTCSCGGYPSCICDSIPLIIRQDELQKWLRDKNINLAVTSYGGTIKPKWGCALQWCIGHDEEFFYPDYESYEEAIEVGLVNSLNLI